MVLFFLVLLASGVWYRVYLASDVVKVAPPEVPLANREVARNLVRRNLQEPIPTDYLIPSYITSSLPQQQVYDSLAKRYPMFYGFHGDQFLDSIVRHPQRFLKMSNENKAIRRYYDPNSRY